MLNRRSLRIRAMQMLYAYKQAEKANLELAKDQIDETFSPDLNSMEFQDKNKLEGLRKLAKIALEEKLSGEFNAEDVPEAAIRAAEKAKSFFEIKKKKDFENLTMTCIKDAERVYDIYLMMLSLFIELSNRSLADERSNGVASFFSDNALLQSLKNHKVFEEQCIRKGISWEAEQPFISKLYREALKNNETYLAYIAKKNHTFEENFSILKYLLKNVFLKHEIAWEFFEQKSLFWTEDIETIRAMVSHTFESGRDEMKIEVLDDDWAEKREFMVMLFKKSIEQSEELEQILKPKLKNWEFERIAETDVILLKMTLIEMMNSPSVPVKVSINEALEIAKEYSTPKSNQFINGILDILAKELQQSGKIRKSGRGLIDNR